MHTLKICLEVIVVISSILLTMLILMHKGKGGGLSDMFGGGNRHKCRDFRRCGKESESHNRNCRNYLGCRHHRSFRYDEVRRGQLDFIRT